MKLKTGKILQGGKYKIVKELGQGGFGITYLAEQVVVVKGGLGEIESRIKVTIKEFFMKGLCDRDAETSHISVGSSGSRELVNKFRGKFIKEAQNIAKLRHRNIIKVLDIFEENGTAYYVMEYIDGGSLADRIKEYGTMSEIEALHYIHQISEALGYIHGQRINHLDVKPSNILLKDGVEAVLIDFGLAKQYDVAGEQTSSTPVGVSKGYAPMEQCKTGGVSTFSPSTDIYSLGATLYKLLTGLTPPEAHDVFDSGLPELPVVLSSRVKQAITAAMQPSRAARPQSITEFVQILGVGAAVSTEVTEITHKPNQIIEPNHPEVIISEVIETEGDEYYDEYDEKNKSVKRNTIIAIAIVAIIVLCCYVGGGRLCVENSNKTCDSTAVVLCDSVAKTEFPAKYKSKSLASEKKAKVKNSTTQEQAKTKVEGKQDSGSHKVNDSSASEDNGNLKDERAEDRTVIREHKNEIIVEEKTPESEKVFSFLEEMPEFPGGDAELMKYLGQNIRYPAMAIENNVQGRVIIQFVVTRSGKVGEVKVARGVDPDLDKEAVRVVKSLPSFIPGKMNGKAVNVWYTLPVTFMLQGNLSTKKNK